MPNGVILMIIMITVIARKEYSTTYVCTPVAFGGQNGRVCCFRERYAVSYKLFKYV